MLQFQFKPLSSLMPEAAPRICTEGISSKRACVNESDLNASESGTSACVKKRLILIPSAWTASAVHVKNAMQCSSSARRASTASMTRRIPMQRPPRRRVSGGLHSPAVPLIRPPNHPSVLNAEEKGAKQSAGQSVKTPATVEKQKQNLTFPPFV